jgi:hypothetical protein
MLGPLRALAVAGAVASLVLGSSPLVRGLARSNTIRSARGDSSSEARVDGLSAPAQCNGDFGWSGAGDGVHWSDSQNWGGNSRPVSGACSITVTTPQTTIVDINVPSTDSLSAGPGTLVVASTLGVNVSAQITGDLNVSSPGANFFSEGDVQVTKALTLGHNQATLGGSAGSITVNGLFTWTAGSLSITGGGVIANGGTTINGFGTSQDLQGKLTNPAGQTVTWSGTSEIHTGSSAKITNLGTFVAETRQTLNFVGSGGLFDNQGLLRKQGSDRTGIGLKINNSGSVQVNSGTLAFLADGTETGSFTVASGATLEFANHGSAASQPPTVFEPTSSLSGAGALNFVGGTHRIKGTFGVTGPVGVTGILLGAQGTVEFLTGSQVMLSSLTLGDATSSSVIGTLAGTDAVVISGPLDIYSASLQGSGTVTAQGGIAKKNSFSFGIRGRTLRNAGLFNWADAGVSFSEINFTSGGVFENLSNGSIDVGGSRRFSTGLDPNGTRNAGLVRILNGATLELFNNDYIQTAGETRLEGGTISISGNVPQSRPLQIRGGLLSGSGTIQGNVKNTGGTVSPGLSPGAITLDGGDYTQEAGGTFRLEIGGTPTTQYDRLLVNHATLAGTLDVLLLNGFIPNSSDTFAFLTTTASPTGNFTTVSFPNGQSGSATSGPNGITLHFSGGGGPSANLTIDKSGPPGPVQKNRPVCPFRLTHPGVRRTGCGRSSGAVPSV